MHIQLSPFQEAFFPDYLRWFSDPVLNRALGPMTEDDPWLEAIRNPYSGLQMAAHSKHELVGVIGIDFPDADHPFCIITNLAVRPDLRGKGLGSAILRDIFAHFSCPRWRAYVDPPNTLAQRFLARNGWQRLPEGTDPPDMFTYEYA